VYLCFQQYAASKHISFSIIGSEATASVFADKEKVEIILFNLFSNAFKFTPNGGTISIAIEAIENTVEVTVKDNGCGIADEVGNRLFQPFYQGNLQENNHPTGFGIGLYLSKKLAEANGGTLSFTSKINEGTSFVLALAKIETNILPIIQKENIINALDEMPKEAEAHETTFLEELMEYVPPEETLSVGAIKNKADIIDKLTSELPSMLIVDDNADMRELIKAVFQHDYNIYEAADGDEGYELALKEVPDIIISDIAMQRVNGIQLCANIKANPAIGHIPVILLTASFSADNKLKGIEGGAEDYITKPFDNEIIKASVKNILQRKNRLQQYFFNAVTLQPNFNIAGEYKEFIEQCITITEKYLDDPDFNIKTFSKEIGMSHPKLYKKVKAVSGLSVNVFIRYLRLKKAAEFLINTNKTINEVTYDVGFKDIKYFREQFHKLFEMNPSEYIKRYRKPLGSKMNA
jgi:DNA-binding response OmpR family regulator